MSNTEELNPDHPLGEVPAEEIPKDLFGDDPYIEDENYNEDNDSVDPNSRGFRATEGPEGEEAE